MLRRVHLVFGLLVFVAFLLTGQYMDKFHNHLEGMPDGVRMLYRTRHIFILLAGMVNLGLAAYLDTYADPLRRGLQLTGSALIIIASVLFIVAFFREPQMADLRTPLSHWGTYTILTGTAAHLLSGARPPVS